MRQCVSWNYLPKFIRTADTPGICTLHLEVNMSMSCRCLRHGHVQTQQENLQNHWLCNTKKHKISFNFFVTSHASPFVSCLWTFLGDSSITPTIRSSIFWDGRSDDPPPGGRRSGSTCKCHCHWRQPFSHRRTATENAVLFSRFGTAGEANRGFLGA